MVNIFAPKLAQQIFSVNKVFNLSYPYFIHKVIHRLIHNFIYRQTKSTLLILLKESASC